MSTQAKEADDLKGTPAEDVLAFEGYRLDAKRHMLFKDGSRVQVAARPMAILIALAERLGEVISNRELEALLWADSYMSDGTLRVHISRLQRALGPTQNGLRFIENHSRRGYRMTVPVRRCIIEAPAIEASLPANPTASITSGSRYGTPRQSQLIGRAECVARVMEILRERPLVTLTGPGGVGKTAVALEVSREMLADYPDGIWVVDLAAVATQHEVASAVAATLGIGPLVPDPLAAVLEFIEQRTSLLVLDNCEHVLDAAARLAQAVVRAPGQVSVLATSRERLHAESERIYRLEPLDVPTLSGPWTRDELLATSAVALFTTRAAGSTGTRFSDAQLHRVAELCRRLTGNPLAIEIAVTRLDQLGLSGLIAALDSGHSLSVVGHRTRVARHWSLRATLDWSYGLLSPLEQTLFRRLGVFCGSFDLEAAVGLMAEGGKLETAAVFEGLLSLISKSMLAHEQAGDQIRYKLHETSRTYALDKLRECEELAAVRHRHVLMWCRSSMSVTSFQLHNGNGWPTVFGNHVEDLRAAIQWCFRESAEVPMLWEPHGRWKAP